MKVPFIDFSEQYQAIKDEIDVGLKGLFERGDFIMGQAARDFEGEFAGYCDASYAVGVNSGTDALYLALSSLKISVGDEVIIPSFTFIATALCISYTGATPVLVDIEEETYNIDPVKIKEAITPKTKAIMPVHLYGQPANMDEINALAREHNITVIEDAAQSHGAKYKGKRVGSLGDIACFSFYPTKSLGAFGDGGIVVTQDESISDSVKMLRDYGRKDRYQHQVKGYNSRLDTLQAIILSEKLKYLDEWNGKRAKAAAYYEEQFRGEEKVLTPTTKKDRTHVYQTYAVRVPDRDQVCEKMKEKGVGVLIHYPIPLHMQEAYADLGHKTGDFPVSEKMAGEVLSLPLFPHIKEEQMDYVCQTLKDVIQ